MAWAPFQGRSQFPPEPGTGRKSKALTLAPRRVKTTVHCLNPPKTLGIGRYRQQILGREGSVHGGPSPHHATDGSHRRPRSVRPRLFAPAGSTRKRPLHAQAGPLALISFQRAGDCRDQALSLRSSSWRAAKIFGELLPHDKKRKRHGSRGHPRWNTSPPKRRGRAGQSAFIPGFETFHTGINSKTIHGPPQGPRTACSRSSCPRSGGRHAIPRNMHDAYGKTYWPEDTKRRRKKKKIDGAAFSWKAVHVLCQQVTALQARLGARDHRGNGRKGEKVGATCRTPESHHACVRHASETAQGAVSQFPCVIESSILGHEGTPPPPG